ncbi:MAG: hypothetical protein ABI333_27490 [bacterium]
MGRSHHARCVAGLAALLALSSLLGCAASNLQQQPTDGGTGVDAGLCGNGTLDPGEECDDGNTAGGDGCSPYCQTEICGPDTCNWGCCDVYGGCQTGVADLECGIGGAECADCLTAGLLCQSHSCQDLGSCAPDDTLECGNCGARTCTQAGAWGACENEGECSAGEVASTGPCGNCGELQRTCHADCTWSGLECAGEGDCAPGETQQGNVCGTCSVEERSCQPDCSWGAWVCVSYQECVPGALDIGSACGDCGQQERVCQTDCTWGQFACQDEGVCGAGDTTTEGCGACGVKTCNAATCEWGVCQNPAETCNGVDDDCDGVCDDGFACCRNTSETCTTSCGSQGNRICNSSCGWGNCQAPAETCNGVDDNCNGVADEGYRAESHNTFYTGANSMDDFNATCNGTTQYYGLACSQAIHLWCMAQDPGCLSSGYGPVETSPPNLTVNCVAGAYVHSVTYATLASYHNDCLSSAPISGGCYYAINHYCQAQGYDNGFGPITSGGSSMEVGCITGSTQINTTFTTLSSYHGPCDGVNQRVGPDCNAAIKRFCAGSGHVGGFGPVSNFNDDAVVVCIDP